MTPLPAAPAAHRRQRDWWGLEVRAMGVGTAVRVGAELGKAEDFHIQKSQTEISACETVV